MYSINEMIWLSVVFLGTFVAIHMLINKSVKPQPRITDDTVKKYKDL